MEIFAVERVVENVRTPVSLVVSDALTLLEDNGKKQTKYDFADVSACVPIADFSFALRVGSSTLFFFAEDVGKVLAALSSKIPPP